MARRIHFIGICGTAMGTLAAMLQRRGDRVRGSDAHVYPPMSDQLRAEGIELLDGYDAAHIDDAIDVVVVGNAISKVTQVASHAPGGWFFAVLKLPAAVPHMLLVPRRRHATLHHVSSVSRGLRWSHTTSRWCRQRSVPW